MIELTKEAIWKTEYDIKREEKEQKEKQSSRLLAIGLITLAVTLSINIVLIYSFFNLLKNI